jgi:hypothetical protein
MGSRWRSIMVRNTISPVGIVVEEAEGAAQLNDSGKGENRQTAAKINRWGSFLLEGQ